MAQEKFTVKSDDLNSTQLVQNTMRCVYWAFCASVCPPPDFARFKEKI